MTAHSRTAFPAALASLLAALAWDAGAVGLGDLVVRSALGEPLDATVALEGATAKPQAGCIRQATPAGAELPALPRATLAIEPDGAGWRLRVRTRTAIHEPATRLRLDATCEARASASRTYEVLLDPRAPEAPSPPMRSVPGDTLASIAAAIYPNRRAVADAYVAALRAANPALAGLAPDEPIAPDTPVALPDLRRFSLSLAVPAAGPRAPAVAAARMAPVPAPASEPPRPPPAQAAAQPRAKPAPPPRPAAPAAKAQDAEPQPPAAAPPQRPATPKAGAPVLRLSSAEIDLSRSRGIDDRTRAQLRERLLILDADDQVAALLSMRHSLRQLEGRVAELQLKLSALPPQAPGPAKAPEPAKAPAPAKPVEAAKVPEPPPVKAPEPAKPVEAAKVPEPPPVKAPEPAKAIEAAKAPEPPTAPEPAKAAEPAKAVEPAKPATAPAPKPPAKTVPAPAEEDGVPAWLWGVLALAVAGIAAVAWRLLSAPRKPGKPAAPAPAAAQASANSDLAEAEAMMRAAAAPPPAPEDHRVVAQSDEALATSVPGADPVALRRRYIEERFPEIASGTIAPTDPDSVVKAARLFYEDGALARAVELLQFSVEENPRNLKPWLALFEIFRLERLAGEFGELAGRFQRFHGASEYWRKVQFIGREIDPGNALYREVPAEQLETIGPVAARKAAAVTFDPLAENWLNAPMDFTKDGLAAGLRAGLLADAGLAEADLADDPMPALKNVEMFTVA